MKHTYINISLGSTYFHIGKNITTKSIPIWLPEPFNKKAYVRFPRINYLTSEGGQQPNAELLNPIPWEDCGIAQPSEMWGKISYKVHGDRYIPQLSIRAFVVDVVSEDFLQPSLIELLKKYICECVNNIICVLSIKQPECLSIHNVIPQHHFVSSCSANYDQPKGNRMIEIDGTCFIVRPTSIISYSILFSLIRQCTKQLTIQYLLLAELRNYLVGGDYRSCVLHACTIFETTLQQKFDLFVLENNVPTNIINFVRRKLNGFSSYELLYSKDFPRCEDPRIKKTTEIRNKVIHEGRNVSKQEAQDAYDAAYLFLQFYNWRIFE